MVDITTLVLKASTEQGLDSTITIRPPKTPMGGWCVDIEAEGQGHVATIVLPKESVIEFAIALIRSLK